jgi:hypothetical protein
MTRLHVVPRRGIALPAAVVTLAIVSLFAAGSAFFTLQESRAARNGLTERAAFEAAEYGATALARDWVPAQALSLPVGGTIGPATFSLAAGATASGRLTRATPTTFWGVSEGSAGSANARTLARRAVGVVYRLALALPAVTAALTVRDSAVIVGGGVVSGTDSLGGGPAIVAACARAGTAVAGAAAPDSTRVCDGACGATSGNIRGIPPLMSDPAAGDSLSYLILGDRSWQQLVAGADLIVPPNATVTPAPVVAAGACQRGLAANWGDPAGASPCAGFFPVIWAQGDVTMNGGMGQGILIAEGDVRLASGARFSGLIVAGDDVVTLGGGGTVLGAAMARDARPGPGDHTIIGGGALVQYSSCALHTALYASAPLIRVRDRAWAEY